MMVHVRVPKITWGAWQDAEARVHRTTTARVDRDAHAGLVSDCGCLFMVLWFDLSRPITVPYGSVHPLEGLTCVPYLNQHDPGVHHR